MLHFTLFSTSKPFLTLIYSKQDLRYLHLPLWGPSLQLSARIDSEVDIYLTLSIIFILHVTVLPFSISFVLVLKRLCTFLYFLPDTWIALQTFQPTLLWWNGYHSFFHCVMPQEFLKSYLTQHKLCDAPLYLPMQWQLSRTIKTLSLSYSNSFDSFYSSVIGIISIFYN